jgi:aryl-alcohol dehydrogenase-like predicted oxidoreductase
LGADCRPNSVKIFAAYSLQRLGVDVIDLYQPGRADPAVPFEETVGAVADLIAALRRKVIAEGAKRPAEAASIPE